MFLYNPWKFHLLFYIILLKLPHTASSIPLFFFLELLIPVKIQTERGHLRTYFFWKSSPGFLDLSLYLWKFQIKWANWAIPEKIQTGKKKKPTVYPWKFQRSFIPGNSTTMCCKASTKNFLSHLQLATQILVL